MLAVEAFGGRLEQGLAEGVGVAIRQVVTRAVRSGSSPTLELEATYSPQTMMAGADRSGSSPTLQLAEHCSPIGIDASARSTEASVALHVARD
jgi:hypothetical protein